MAKNNFLLNDNGIIEVTTTGDRTASLIQSSATQIFAFVAGLRKAGKPILILNDVSQMGELPPEALKIFAEITKNADFDRFAMTGSDPTLKLGVTLVAQAIGKPGKLQYFETYDEAAEWLLAFKQK